MNFNLLDLNLLLVFDAIMRDRSVTKAGREMGLSQPAISHALRRLRFALKDELFVRTPDGMIPTPLSEKIATPIHRILIELQVTLEPQPFVPAEAQRQFTIAVNNYAALLLAPPLLAATCEKAPNVRLDLRPSGKMDVPARLDSGELDLAIVSLGHSEERFSRELILEDRLVAIMRRDHPSTRGCDGQLSPEIYAELRHLEITASGEPDIVGLWSAERGLEYTVLHRTPLLAAASVLEHSDMVTVQRKRVAENFVRNVDGLAIWELPFESPVVPEYMLWHRRFDNLPAHRWLRELILEVSRTFGESGN